MNIFKEYQSVDALSMSLRAEEQMIDAFGTCYLNGNKIDDFFDYNNIIKENLKQYNNIYNVNDIVYKHNKGILYHFTFDDEITNRILKSGLRVKKAEYRNFPKRIYLYRTKNVYGNLLDDTDDILKFLFEMFKTTPKVLFNISNKMQIIKVDLNRLVGIKHELNFFKDTSMKSNQTIFTYNNIHKDALYLLNNKFLEKLKEKLIANIKF